jgi:hypothetical protein
MANADHHAANVIPIIRTIQRAGRQDPSRDRGCSERARDIDAARRKVARDIGQERAGSDVESKRGGKVVCCGEAGDGSAGSDKLRNETLPDKQKTVLLHFVVEPWACIYASGSLMSISA